MIKNKRILITGIAGSIGEELTRQLYKNNKIYGVDINEIGVLDLIGELKIWGRVGDIKDEKMIRDVFSDFKPQIIFHAAAYKSVNMMEGSPLEAIKTNILGLYNVIDCAQRWECLEKFIFISTDKAVNPNTIMGATKKVGEILVKNQGKGFIAVRFGNVLGSRGSLIPIWQKQINKGEPITITDKNMTRYFMTIPEAVNLVIKAAEIGKGGEIIILDMGKKIKIYDLAQKIIKEINGKIKIIGKRQGEQLTEEIMTQEEKSRAIKKDNFFIIK